MDVPATRKFSLILVMIFLLLPIGATKSAFGQKQKIDTDKIDTAVSRSKKAAEIIKAVMTLPDGKGIPKEVTEKANMIGVVPDAFRLSLLFSQATRGHGVFSVRRENGWSLPVYYFYGASPGFDLSKIGTRNFDLVFIVVNAKITEDPKDKSKPKTKDKSEKAKLFLYSFASEILTPITHGGNSVLGLFKTSDVVYDDSLNKLAYGVKGDDVASGKATDPKPVEPEITAFRDALNELYPVK